MFHSHALLYALVVCGVVGMVSAAPVSASAPPDEPLHIVFVTGDEEYRSEESMPMLARILHRDYGFKVTVCYSLAEDGTIDPNRTGSVSGLEALDDADLMVMFMRFRALPDDQLQHIVKYIDSGRPAVGFRTATHCFRYPGEDERSALYNAVWPRHVWGQKWVTHHGHHGDNDQRLTHVSIPLENADHPVLRGVKPFDAYSWLYHVEGGGDTLEGENITRLVFGRSLISSHEQAGRTDRFPLTQPVAWTKTLKNDEGTAARIFFTTLGHPYDFREESMRKLALNGILWALGLEAQIPDGGANAEPVGDYDPPPSGFGNVYRPGVTPEPIGDDEVE